MRRYIERSNGEVVMEFSRCEVFPSSPVASSTCLNLADNQSIGLSPFDMAKVRAALEADAIDNHGEDESHHDNDVVDPDFIPSNVSGIDGFGREEKHDRSFVPLGKSATESILRQFEELLYTSDLEEELLRRNVFINRQDGDDCLSMVIISEENEGHRLQTPIPADKRDKIKEYATKRCEHNTARFRPLTKNGELQYDEIVETLAESILDSIIEDVAGELEDQIVEETGNIVLNL